MSSESVSTALILAAGMGKRLHPLTRDIPKCLISVNGIPILERQVSSLIANDFNRLFVVTGHLSERIRTFLSPFAQDIDITFVHAPRYRETNNICSLWEARNQVSGPFLLLEADLVFEPDCLAALKRPDRIAVASPAPWMNGTTVTLGKDGRVNRFLSPGEAVDSAEPQFKTVNICSLSKASWQAVVTEIKTFMDHGSTHLFYESAFNRLAIKGKISLKPVSFNCITWYEIDTPRDLAEAEQRFADFIKIPSIEE